MTDTIRWGILGTGNIARAFAEGLSVLPDAALVAVGSRNQKTADEFGVKFGVPNRHASYEALANDPEVDVIYIATPHSLHRDNTLLCLDAGKAVLCEKPFAINAADSQIMIDRAREKNLFLMEAMWMRFIPAIIRAKELLDSGAIGDVLMLQSDFGYRDEFDPKGRAFDPEVGGGALLDVGIYPITLAYLMFGEPAAMSSQAYLGKTGVDDQCGMVFRHAGGQISMLHSAVIVETPCEAEFSGSKGQLKIHYPFWVSQKLTLKTNNREQVMDIPIVGNGYNYEAQEVMRCVRAGKIESDLCPHAETLAIMKIMDNLRAEWGLKYPGE